MYEGCRRDELRTTAGDAVEAVDMVYVGDVCTQGGSQCRISGYLEGSSSGDSEAAVDLTATASVLYCLIKSGKPVTEGAYSWRWY